MITVTRSLSAGKITMSSSFFSRLRACCSSLVKLLSCSDADCKVEAILLLMLSLVDSDSSRCRDRAASTIASVGIRFGVTECFSPSDSTRVSFLSKGREEMFLTQLSSGLLRLCSLLRRSPVSFCWCPVRARSVALLSRLSAIVVTMSSNSVGISCFSLSWSCCVLFL